MYPERIVAEICFTLLRGTEALPELRPHSFLLLRLAGAQKKQAAFHRVGCCLLFAFILSFVF